MTDEPVTVVAAAIRNPDTGAVTSMPPPARHHTIIQSMGKDFRQFFDQGFVLSDGRWATRKAALSIAYRSGQLPDGGGVHPFHGLFSEDLW